MIRRSLAACIAAIAVCAGAARLAGQTPPDFSGTWKLDRAASQIATGTGIAGLGASGAPNTLYISQAANGTVVIGSDVNESQARTFRVGGGAISSKGPESHESASVSADGQTLTITVVAARAAGETRSTLTYKKTPGEDPCEKWPTPCRYPAGSRF
jgi:hypothetical protein